jgi:hypothetical protein
LNQTFFITDACKPTYVSVVHCRYRKPNPRVTGGSVYWNPDGLRSRARLEAETLVLRQQVIVLSRKSRSRVGLRNIHRLIFVWLYRLFPSILNAITLAKPKTVIGWHQRGFRGYWRWKSRRRGGRPRINREIRDLIQLMNKENPLWGVPRIHSELAMLGIEPLAIAAHDSARLSSRCGHRVGEMEWPIFVGHTGRTAHPEIPA